jgi:hypothetical protein
VSTISLCRRFEDDDFRGVNRMRLAPHFHIVVVAALSPTAAGAIDLSTPERAVASYFEAFGRRDADGAVAARDFEFEARHAHEESPGSEALDEEAVKRTAKVAEAALRARLQADRIHGLDYSQCKHITTRRLQDNVAEVFLDCPSPGGGSIFEAMLAARSEVGWRVALGPVGQLPLRPAQ